MDDLSHVGMLNCWICGEATTILITKDLRATLPRKMGSLPTEVCNDCKTLANNHQGIWLISIRNDEKPGTNDMLSWNPFRTGGLALIKKDALRRILKSDGDETRKKNMLAMLDQHYYFYLNDSTWDHLGLPPRGVKINNLEGNNEQ